MATPAHVAIFGQGVFAPRRGLAGVPVGCFGTAVCTVTSRTISLGRSTLVKHRTGAHPAGGGLAFFKLSSTAQKMLTRAVHHQLSVRVKVSDSAGSTVSRVMRLNSFATTNPSPLRRLSQSSQLRLIGTADFVSNGWVGGVLAECVGSVPCQTTLQIRLAGKLIATAHRSVLGTGQLGYLFFSLTPAGHRLLTHARGNQLGVSVTATTLAPPSTSSTASNGGAGAGTATASSPTTTATGHIALIAY